MLKCCSEDSIQSTYPQYQFSSNANDFFILFLLCWCIVAINLFLKVNCFHFVIGKYSNFPRLSVEEKNSSAERRKNENKITPSNTYSHEKRIFINNNCLIIK